jgi:TonB family protein
MTVLIVPSALSVSVILLVALIAVVLLRTRSAALRHWVLAVAVACACATPLVSAVLPPWLGVAVWSPHVSPDGREAPQAGQRASPAVVPMQGAAVQTEFSLPLAPRVSFVSSSAGRAALAVWFLGSLGSVFILFIGLVRLRWLASGARDIEAGPWFTLAEELRRSYALASSVRLLQSNHSSLLVTWGWGRPKILLPAAARDWSDDRIKVVLAHELAHIARGDWGFQLAAEVLRVLYWFNPLLWIACRRLRVESERACDDAVLARGTEAPEYATHLLALARSLHPGRQPWLPAPAMARPSSLEGRIRAMLNNTLNRRPVSWPARVATVGALLTLTVSVGGLLAQSQFYSLSGTALDPTNRVLPNTRVVLTNPTNQAKYEVRTDATGRFEFVGLPLAQYTLEAILPGFSVLKESINVSGNTDRELRLRVGSLEETITVTDASVPAPEPDAATLQKRDEARRRLAAFVESVKAKCAAGVTRVAVGGNILAPRKLLDVRPLYPENLRAAKVGGTVTMNAVIGTDGLVRDVQNVKGPHPDLEIAAANAVRQWQFSATLLNCEPIEVDMKVSVSFKAMPQ